MQLHVSLCGTTVVGSSLENSALSGKLELKLRSKMQKLTFHQFYHLKPWRTNHESHSL